MKKDFLFVPRHLGVIRAISRSLAMLATLFLAHPTHAVLSFQAIAPTKAVGTGQFMAGAEMSGRLLLANEGHTTAGVILDFDLTTVSNAATPMARIALELEKVAVSPHDNNPPIERGVIHVFVVGAAGNETLAGSMHVKPAGDKVTYLLDVSGAVNAVLARKPGDRNLRLAVRLTGKPIPYEVYALSPKALSLEIASPENWMDDHDKRVRSILNGVEVYRESCLPLTEDRAKEIELKLLFSARKVTEVIALGTGEHLEEGRDWVLRDGRVILPSATRAPVQLASEFFVARREEKDGSTILERGAIRQEHGPWYHERQLEISYEPAIRDWEWPKPLSSLEQLPRTQRLLQTKTPLSIILFGDSISEGFDASRKGGVWPYQSGYAELVVRELQKFYGAPITFMNHARGGGTSGHAATQADAQVAWFKPDLVLLAYGMNDRGEDRRFEYRENLEKIIELVRLRSPATEFIVITPMLNNPKQPTGLDPVKYIRDEALRLKEPGVAVVDITSTELAMLDRKDYLDLSGNGVNHPNDFLLRIYAQRILEVLVK